MASSSQHYATHLAPVYLWMSGGADAALQAGEAEVAALGAPAQGGDVVVDLGAGFGLHAIPLARRGARVIAIDSSPQLLQELARLGEGLGITAVEGDLLAFEAHLPAAPAAILCLGDTLTHLPTVEAVDALLQAAARTLAPGGQLVLGFRDYTTALQGDQRFIAVRSDRDRILTCFLEYEQHFVIVHDLLQERGPQGWQLRVSHYRKLRLDPDAVLARLVALGLEARRETGVRGMVRLGAVRR